MPPRKASPKAKASPKRKNTDKERINELEKQLSDQQRKSKKLIDQVGDFQDEVGGAIIPYQRLVLYVTVVILFTIGLGMVIYAACHPEMDDAQNTRDNMYVSGAILLTAAFFGFLLGRWWLRSVEKSPGLRKLNATMFELEMARDVFRR